jgi:mRNA interferase MazF
LGKFVKGDVAVIPFPFSDLTQTKRRPALVLAELPGDDLILCQITTNLNGDRSAVLIETKDFVNGKLDRSSNIRPNKLFTADQNIIIKIAGHLKPEKTNEAIQKLKELLDR